MNEYHGIIVDVSQRERQYSKSLKILSIAFNLYFLDARQMTSRQTPAQRLYIINHLFSLMREDISLEELIPNLRNPIIKLNIKFLKLLLLDASKSNIPYRNENFCKSIRVKWNERYKESSAVRNWFKGDRNIRLDYLNKILLLSRYTWKDIEGNLIFMKAGTPKGEIHIRFPIRIDEKLGSIVGYIMGDGSIDKLHNIPFFTNQNKELLNEFINNMLEVFGAKPRIMCQSNGNFKDKKSKWLYRVEEINEIKERIQVGLFYKKIVGITLLAIFGEFSLGKHKEITTNILIANKEFKRGFIRAFFDSEGNFSKDQIRVFQDNKEVLEKLSEIIKEFEIVPNQTKSYIKREKKRYYFSISGYYNLLKFYNEIGFTSSKKAYSLKSYIDMINKNKTFKLRYKETKKVIIYLLKEYGHLRFSEISKHLKSIYPDLKWNNKTITYHLKCLIKDDIIEKQNSGYKLLKTQYDLETPLLGHKSLTGHLLQ